MSELSISEKYFEEYRQNKKRVQELTTEIKAAREKVEILINQREELNREIYSMQMIITDMVDNGWDPVEAKLKRETDIYRSNLWEERFNSADGGGSSTTMLTTITAPVSLGVSSLSATVTAPKNGTSQSPKRTFSKILNSFF